jgi:dihydropteroate synthase
MGILNVTPDSFSDGGELRGADDALRRGEAMLAQGASLLDVGGESTRPGARSVPVAEELRRVIPVVEALVRRLPLPVSVDTRKAEVARAALDAGAAVVNDVSGLAYDPRVGEAVARAGAGLVLMHMRGTPREMQELARYGAVGREVAAELREAVGRARRAGVAEESIVLDPGIGFAKTADQSLQLLRDLGPVRELGFPLLVGPSRKSFLGRILEAEPSERTVGSAVACALAFQQGALILRVHDVAAAVEALAVAAAVRAGEVSAGVRVRTAGASHGRAGEAPHADGRAQG